MNKFYLSLSITALTMAMASPSFGDPTTVNQINQDLKSLNSNKGIQSDFFKDKSDPSGFYKDFLAAVQKGKSSEEKLKIAEEYIWGKTPMSDRINDPSFHQDSNAKPPKKTSDSGINTDDVSDENASPNKPNTPGKSGKSMETQTDPLPTGVNPFGPPPQQSIKPIPGKPMETQTDPIPTGINPFGPPPQPSTKPTPGKPVETQTDSAPNPRAQETQTDPIPTGINPNGAPPQPAKKPTPGVSAETQTDPLPANVNPSNGGGAGAPLPSTSETAVPPKVPTAGPRVPPPVAEPFSDWSVLKGEGTSIQKLNRMTIGKADETSWQINPEHRVKICKNAFQISKKTDASRNTEISQFINKHVKNGKFTNPNLQLLEGYATNPESAFIFTYKFFDSSGPIDVPQEYFDVFIKMMIEANKYCEAQEAAGVGAPTAPAAPKPGASTAQKSNLQQALDYLQIDSKQRMTAEITIKQLAKSANKDLKTMSVEDIVQLYKPGTVMIPVGGTVPGGPKRIGKIANLEKALDELNIIGAPERNKAALNFPRFATDAGKSREQLNVMSTDELVELYKKGISEDS